MSTRTELEAALAEAEADWRRAGENLDKKHAEPARANDAWDRALVARREARAVWDQARAALDALDLEGKG